MLVESLDKEEKKPETYGLDFWEKSLKRYEEKLKEAPAADNTITNQVQDKKALHKELSRVLRSLAKVIEANYPDNHKDMLQKWGF